jgi:hypothetical protein
VFEEKGERMKSHPDTTYTLSPEEQGTYEVGDKVSLGGITFEVENIIHPTKVKLRWAPTKWEIFKHWLKVKHTWPTWIFVRAILPFTPNHAWHEKRHTMTQIDWYLKATPLTKQTSTLLWWHFFIMAWLIGVLIYRS